jgi:nucleotide-binding universal stress UspA family protein
MYKHILIPTDGSDLSKNAAQHGIALAKAVNAKVTAITVSTPFHVFAVDPDMLIDTSESYKKRMTTIATKYLGQVKDAAAEAGVSCYSPCRARASFPSYYRCGEN